MPGLLAELGAALVSGAGKDRLGPTALVVTSMALGCSLLADRALRQQASVGHQ